MVDPMNITKFDRTEEELQEFAIFAVCVAGKTAKSIAPRVAQLIKNMVILPNKPDSVRTFDMIALMQPYRLANMMKDVGIGCFNQKADTICMLAQRVHNGMLNLRTCTPEDLEKIKGIGAKTSRFFILHSRANARYAALDTHILKHLTAWEIPQVPLSTPPKGPAYARLERAFLNLADAAGMTPADYDLMLWRHYSAGEPLTAA